MFNITVVNKTKENIKKMGDLLKGILIGAGVATVIVGAFIPFGEKKESVADKIFKQKED